MLKIEIHIAKRETENRKVKLYGTNQHTQPTPRVEMILLLEIGCLYAVLNDSFLRVGGSLAVKVT